VTWTPTVVGSHSLTAVAVDNQGSSTTSPAVTVTINAAIAPTITASKPVAGETIWTPDTYHLQGTYTGPAGSTITIGSLSATLAGGAWQADMATTSMFSPLTPTIFTPAGTSAQVSIPITIRPARVTILSPAQGTEVYASPATVTVQLDGPADATMTINGVAATRNGNLFTVSLPVVTGSNTITAIASWRTFSAQASATFSKVDYAARALSVTSPAA
jgi:hypothetical protein